MKKLLLYSTLAFLIAAPGFAKDDKKKDKDKDKDRVVYVERDGTRYYVDKDGKRHRVANGERDRSSDRYRDDHDGRQSYGSYGKYSRERSRTIYVIERGRPVEREVYLDSDGRYFRVIDGRRIYVQERHYESYPSKYFYPDGRRRVTITLPF